MGQIRVELLVSVLKKTYSFNTNDLLHSSLKLSVFTSKTFVFNEYSFSLDAHEQSLPDVLALLHFFMRLLTGHPVWPGQSACSSTDSAMVAIFSTFLFYSLLIKKKDKINCLPQQLYWGKQKKNKMRRNSSNPKTTEQVALFKEIWSCWNVRSWDPNSLKCEPENQIRFSAK